MTDARLPERLLVDRRLRKLSATDFRSYVMALVYSVSNRTDGVIESEDLPMIPQFDPNSVPTLVREGMWSASDGEWTIVDFRRDQSSKDELEVLDNARRADREKKRRLRAAKKESLGLSPGLVPGTAQDRTGRTGSR